MVAATVTSTATVAPAASVASAAIATNIGLYHHKLFNSVGYK